LNRGAGAIHWKLIRILQACRTNPLTFRQSL
jgi:hypothetical protein